MRLLLIALLCLTRAEARPARRSAAEAQVPQSPATQSPASSKATRAAQITWSARPELDRAAREMWSIRAAISPELPASAGLFEDADRLPSYAPAAVDALVARIDASLRSLASVDTKGWSVDEQIDLRWTWTWLLEARRRLVVERMWEHRPGEWLEPTSNAYLALLTYAPERTGLRVALTAQLPTMLTELRTELKRPTSRDVETGKKLLDSLVTMVSLDPPSPAREAALAALAETSRFLEGLSGLQEYAVIGEENYAWRLKHVLLLPWTPDELLAVAKQELSRVDAEIAALEGQLEPQPTLSEAQKQEAAGLDQAGLLALYDGLVEDYLGRLRASGALTVPAGVGPLRARPTPDALIPLTGDGGSMNPAPTFGGSNIGYWNVQHVGADWALPDREGTLAAFRFPDTSGIGPYAVHEGVPGHHLQLGIARLNPDPLRSVLFDNVMVEGWALYAEQLFWEHGGFGDSARAKMNMLRSWRFRIRRVIYDVNVETGRWTLQQAADFKYGAAEGQGHIDEDLLRSINWPTQLICYFSGKMQILALRERARAGAGYSDRAFHDALLGVGSVPLALVAAKLNGDPLPPLEPPEAW